MKKLINLLLFILSSNLIIAQIAPEIEWQNTIGGDMEDKLYSLQQTTDGGYILGGWSQSGISGDKTEENIGSYDYWVVKVNSVGIIEWQNTIGGSNDDWLYSLQQTTDGGYILAGSSSSGISGDKNEARIGIKDYWVVKLNASGAIEWQNTIGGSEDDEPFSIQQTTDDGYILGGKSKSGLSGDKTEPSLGGYDYWVVKINSSGAIEWQNTIGGEETDELRAIQQTTDGGYILGGNSKSPVSGDKTEAKIGDYDYWVVKINSSGAIEWQNTIGGDDADELQSIQQTSDEGYILGGNSYSGISGDKIEANKGIPNPDYWVVKLNSSGSIEWQNTIGGNGGDILQVVRQTLDGGYILAGYSDSEISDDKTEANIGYGDYWVIKLKNTGAIQWQNTIGGTNNDYLVSIDQTADQGYILGGWSESGVSGDKTQPNTGLDILGDYWIVKLEPEDVCSVPSPVGAFNITSTSAKLKWDAIEAATNYQIYYRPVGASTWQKKNATANQKTVTGLLCNTNYEWKVRSKCGIEFTDFSSLQTFTTGACRLGEPDVASEISIYPNPNSGEFTIDLSEINSEENTSVIIKNMLGEEVYSAQLNSPQQIINLGSSVAEGIYLVEMHTSEMIITRQVVVQR
jgi:hypothetical protein